MRPWRLSRLESRRLLKATIEAHQSQLGRAARGELEAKVEAALAWAEERFDPALGTFRAFARVPRDLAVSQFFAAHTVENLRHELEDDRLRDAATRDDAGLISFLKHVRRKITWLQRHRPLTWHVAGMTPEEFRDHAELELIDFIRTGRFVQYERRAGVEATFLALRAVRYRLRKVHELVELDLGQPRDAHVARITLVLGRTQTL